MKDQSRTRVLLCTDEFDYVSVFADDEIDLISVDERVSENRFCKAIETHGLLRFGQRIVDALLTETPLGSIAEVFTPQFLKCWHGRRTSPRRGTCSHEKLSDIDVKNCHALS